MHGLGLSLCIALSFILAGIVLLKLRQARLAWSASLLAWFRLAAAAAQIERSAILPNQISKLTARGQLELDEPLCCEGFCGAILCGCRGAFAMTSISNRCKPRANGTPLMAACGRAISLTHVHQGIRSRYVPANALRY
jgi:hypothetical protein